MINYISVQDNHCNKYTPPKYTTGIVKLLKQNQEIMKDNMPKYSTVNIESVSNVRYIFNYKNYVPNIDGIIGETKQQKFNCWLLSGVNALSNTEKGKNIIKKLIKKNSDNSISVYLKGANYTITIPCSTFEAAKLSNSYVNGDDDMLAIELATEFYKRKLLETGTNNIKYGPNNINGKTVIGTIKDPLSGGYSSDIMYLLTGKFSKTFFNTSTEELKTLTRNIEKIRKTPEKYAATCNFKKQQNGLYINHAYAIKKIYNDTVILINPHDTSNEEIIPLNDFLNNIKSLTVLEL